MGNSDSPDMVIGTFGDPSVFYGPSASRVMSAHRETETGVLDIAPLDGPLASGAEASGTAKGQAMVNPKAFVRTPAGLLCILLVVALVLFDRVFGAAA